MAIFCQASLLLLFPPLALAQPAEVTEHPFYRSVWPTITNNQPDSFGIKMNSYYGSPEDSLVVRLLCEAALAKGIQTESELWQLEAYHAFSLYHSYEGEVETALGYVLKAAKLLPNGTVSQRLNNSNLQGNYHRALENTAEAIASYSQGITTFETLPDKVEVARIGAILYFNRSSIYLEKNNILSALSDCLQALDCAALNEEATQNLVYRMMSRLYRIQKEFADESISKLSLPTIARLALENRTPFDSALAMIYQIEITPSVEEGELLFARGEAIADRHNLSLVIKAGLKYQMSLLYEEKGLPHLQEEMIEQMIALYPDTSIITTPLMMGYVLRSKFCLDRGQTEAAIYWAKQVIRGSKTLPNQAEELKAVRLLSEAYAEQGNYLEAYLTKLTEASLQDSLKVRADPASLLKTYLEYQYQQEKKIQALKTAQEKDLMAAKISRQRVLIAATVVCLLLLSGLIFQLLDNIRFKRRTQQSLLRQKQLLQQNNEQLVLSSNIISHDILSNLELIIASGNVLVGADESEERLRNYYFTTQRVSAKLKSYCVDLLTTTYRKAEAFFTNENQVNATIKEMLQYYSDRLTALGFDVVVKQAPGLPLPQVVLEQVLHAGISNVLQYVPQPDRTPCLRIGGQVTTDGRPCLYIEDNGPGIDVATKAKILQGKRANNKDESQYIGLVNLQSHLKTYNFEARLEEVETGGLRLVVVPFEQ